MASSTTSDQLTPLAGSPVLAIGRRRRHSPTRPKSLSESSDPRVAEDDIGSRRTNPIERMLQASTAIGAGASAIAAMAVVSLPNLDSRAKATLALIGLIYSVFYLTFGALLRRTSIAPRMLFGASMAEALLPTLVVAILASLELQTPLVAIIGLSAAMLALSGTRLSPSSVVFVGVLSSSCLTAALLLFRSATLVQLLAPLAWLALATIIAAVGAQYMRDFLSSLGGHLAHATRLENELRRYLSEEVAAAILLDQDQVPERRAVTVLFCDLRGFTFLCERERPEDVVELLNTVYEGTCRIIHTHGGSVNKFLGDGLLATFSQGNTGLHHTQRAAEAALEMQQWIRFLRERGGMWTHVAMGIGIDTGDVVAGPVGGANRREYTVIGPCVNRAARLQAFAERDYQRIVLSQAARDSLPEDMALRSLGTVELKGFARAETIYTLHQDISS